MMLISIVTINYKKKELTVECIDSLYKQFGVKFEDNEIEHIIIDNDSEDDSVSFLRKTIKEKKYKNVHVIANDTNAGFSAGCNKGAQDAKGKYLLFLNNDTVVKDGGILSMASYMNEHQNIAVLGGQMRNLDGSLQPSSGKFYNLYYATLLLLGGQRAGVIDQSPKTIEKVDWVKGSLLMIRRDIFEELNGFDEKIFMYTEDMELCYRVHKLGKDVYFYPNLMVLHKEHASSSKTFAIVNIYKNLLYFYKKHKSGLEFETLKVIMIAKAKILIVVGKVTGKKYLVETYEKALAAV